MWNRWHLYHYPLLCVCVCTRTHAHACVAWYVRAWCVRGACAYMYVVCVHGVCVHAYVVCMRTWCACMHVHACVCVCVCFFFNKHLLACMFHYYGVILHALMVTFTYYFLSYVQFRTLTVYLYSILCSVLFCLCIL